MKHIFIVNPAAGKSDRTAEYREMIDAAFAPRGLSYELLVSNAPGECRTLARQAAQSGEEVRLYACGGDGTLNEVVNGVVGYGNAAVTHFPGGSGNDTIKIFDDPAAFTSIERLLDAEEARFDLIRCNGSYALNVLSIGFDARVGTDIARFKRLPLVSGKGAYILSIFSNMLHGLTADYTVTLDSGKVFSGRKTMICVCNGRFYGGGFNPVPETDPTDGLLDVLLVKKVSRLQVSSIIGKYKNGRYKDYPDVIRHFRTDSVKILCDKPTAINLDGELRTSDVVNISVAQEKVRFFYPKDLSWQAKDPAHC